LRAGEDEGKEMRDALLTLNAGSSSLKFTVFIDGEDPQFLVGGQLQALQTHPRFSAKDHDGKVVGEHDWGEGATLSHLAAIDHLVAWGRSGVLGDHQVSAIGHRVVHGGLKYTGPVLIDAKTVEDLEALVPLAPLHQPHSLTAIKAAFKIAPHLPQVACFDTAFHRTQPHLAQTFAIPRRYTNEGVRRYGFHGLSYEYIASVLHRIAPVLATARVVVAHLGNGASMCAMNAGQSMATTMGFTAVDGLPMGTRSGALDPGVMLYLIERHGMGARALEKLLYTRSGLLGVSGISSDMRALLSSTNPKAAEAVDLFVYRVGRELGSLAAAIGGLDALVFTGGIGENSAEIRARVCRAAEWLGIDFDDGANQSGGPRISREGSRASAWVVPTNEELMIALHTRRVLAGRDTSRSSASPA
jgi:acetate kinase